MIQEPEITAQDVDGFRRDGAIRLRGLFSSQGIASLRGLIEDATREPGPHRDLFARAAYDFANEDSELGSMIRHAALSAVVDRVIGRPLYFTQTVAFDLHQGDTGFPWHIGFISFKYIQTTDYGYTLWVPLAPVRLAGQRGGLLYTPRTLLCGWARARLAGRVLEQPDWRQLIRHLATPPGELELLERFKVEQDFELGDALLFDRFVYHRSEALLPGPLAHRPAFVFRFVDAGARLSRAVLDRRFPGEERSPSTFREMFAGAEDDQPISSFGDRLILVGATGP